MTQKSRRAVIYARISQDRTGAGLGVKRQAEDCQKLADSLGHTVVRTYTDDDVSAYSGKPRPAYQSMLADLEAGIATAVLVWHTDRLHRSPLELEAYVDLAERRGVVTHSVQSGELDLATPSGRAVARTLGAWARFESEHKSERIKRAHAQGAEAGKFMGGAWPYGWDRGEDGPVINPAEAGVVREATTRILAGGSIGSVVDGLNGRGVPSPSGKPWNYTSMRQILRRARNAGLSEFHGEIVGTSTFPAIITEDQWRALLALFADPSRRRSQSNRVRWLLAGLARCECGATVKSASSNRRDGSTVPQYRCRERGPGHVSKMAEPTDDVVRAVMVARLSKPDVLDALAPQEGSDLSELGDEAQALRVRLDGAADAYATGDITQVQLQRITRQIRERLADVESAMTSTPRVAAVASLAGPDAAGLWDAATVETRRAVVDALASVTLRRLDGKWKRQFHPESVVVDWRQA